MTAYQTLQDADVRGKRVLVRVDHNVETDPSGALKDDTKIRATLPTLEFLLKKGARLILMTHVGRPKGKCDPKLSTKPIMEHLKTLLPGVAMTHTDATVGPDVEKAASALKDGSILYLENVRFHPEEEGSPEQQEALGKQLAALAEVFVNEAFPSCHEYEEASTCAVARLLPAYAGVQLLKEVEHLGRVVDDPRRPLTLIMSGAKMETKLPVIEQFLDRGDDILLGGCIANTFIAARGFAVGKSKYEEEFLEKAQELMLEADKVEKANIHVPRDVVVADAPTDAAEVADLPVEDIEGDMAIYDVGKVSMERYAQTIAKSGMIVWNGPLGLFEVSPFAGASKRLAEAVAKVTKGGAISIIGGGDTLDFHTRYGLPLSVYTFVSTGGGAMLEFIGSGGKLPALEALQKK